MFPSEERGLNVDQQDWIDEALQAFHQDVEDFWVPKAVCRLTQPISALTFLRVSIVPMEKIRMGNNNDAERMNSDKHHNKEQLHEKGQVEDPRSSYHSSF